MSDNDPEIKFILDQSRLKEFNRLMRICKFNSREELMNSALTALDYMICEIEKGNKVGSVYGKSGIFTAFKMPVFYNIEKTSDKLKLIGKKPNKPNLKLVKKDDEE